MAMAPLAGASTSTRAGAGRARGPRFESRLLHPRRFPALPAMPADSVWGRLRSGHVPCMRPHTPGLLRLIHHHHHHRHHHHHNTRSTMPAASRTPFLVAAAAALLPLLLAALPPLLRRLRAKPRAQTVPVAAERILILGASSGTGAALARAYARRCPARIVLVARRQAVLDDVRNDCIAILGPGHAHVVHTLAIDCAAPADVHRLASAIAPDGIDTVHLCFGSSALKPLLAVAGVDPVSAAAPAPDSKPRLSAVPSAAALAHVGTVMQRMSDANQAGTALALAALVPLLQTTSARGAFVVLSSMAALVPAPTRSVYGAAKAAQLILAEGVALEAERQAREPGRAPVRISTVLPGTIATGFRASAVDLAPGETPASITSDASWDAAPSASGHDTKRRLARMPVSASSSDILTPDQVARTMIHAADYQVSGRIAIPSKYAWAARIQPFAPGFLARKAHQKYGY